MIIIGLESCIQQETHMQNKSPKDWSATVRFENGQINVYLSRLKQITDNATVIEQNEVNHTLCTHTKINLKSLKSLFQPNFNIDAKCKPIYKGMHFTFVN